MCGKQHCMYFIRFCLTYQPFLDWLVQFYFVSNGFQCSYDLFVPQVLGCCSVVVNLRTMDQAKEEKKTLYVMPSSNERVACGFNNEEYYRMKNKNRFQFVFFLLIFYFHSFNSKIYYFIARCNVVE